MSGVKNSPSKLREIVPRDRQGAQAFAFLNIYGTYKNTKSGHCYSTCGPNLILVLITGFFDI